MVRRFNLEWSTGTGAIPRTNFCGFRIRRRRSRPRAKTIAAPQRRSARGEYVPAWNYLTAYLRLGDKEQALVWLAKTVEEPNWFALQLKINPILDVLRSDPRFDEIVATLTVKN